MKKTSEKHQPTHFFVATKVSFLCAIFKHVHLYIAMKLTCIAFPSILATFCHLSCTCAPHATCTLLLHCIYSLTYSRYGTYFPRPPCWCGPRPSYTSAFYMCMQNWRNFQQVGLCTYLIDNNNMIMEMSCTCM